MSDQAADFQALPDAAGSGGTDGLVGRLFDLRHYAGLVTFVAATVRNGTIRVPK